MRGLDSAKFRGTCFGVLRGGNTNNTSNAGAFYFNLSNNVNNTNYNIACRVPL